MSDTPLAIQVGDRVRWRSTRANSKGVRMRVGTVIKVHDAGGYAFIKPDKGNGHYQFISLRRLRKEGAA